MSGPAGMCGAGNQELTLLRTTRRATAPLGEFQATYTGTGDLVPGLTRPYLRGTFIGDQPGSL